MKNIFVFLFLNCALVYGQVTPYIDSLKKVVSKHQQDTLCLSALAELCWEYQYVNDDSAILFGERGVDLAKILRNREKLAVCYSHLAQAHLIAARYQTSLLYFTKALETDQGIGDPRNIILDYANIANVHQRIGDYDRSITIYLECLKYFESKADTSSIVTILFNLGNNSAYQFLHKEAITYHSQAFTLATKIKDSTMAAWCLNSIGTSLTKLGKFNEAISPLFRSLSYFESVDDINGVATSKLNLGVLYQESGMIDSAIMLYRESFNLHEQIQDVQGIMLSLTNLATVYSFQGNFSLSAETYHRVIAISLNSNAKRERAAAYMGLAEMNVLRENYKDAYHFQLAYTQLRDSILNEDRIFTIEDLSAKYEAGKRDEKIELLTARSRASELESQQKNFLIWMISGSFIVFVLFVILYMRFRRIREKQRTTELEQRALRAQMNPHFIFNSLNSIQRLFIEGKMDAASDYMSDFASLMRTILDIGAVEKITLSKEIEVLKIYLELEKLRSANGFDYELKIDPAIHTNDEKVPPMLLQPLVENAIWHGILPSKRKGLIQIIVGFSSTSQNCLSYLVEDNGVGFGNKTNVSGHSSKALEICQKRIGSGIRIEKPEGGGTRVLFDLKRTS